MKKTLLFLSLTLLTASYCSSKTIVKLLLPANCKASTTFVVDVKKDNSTKLEIFPNPNDGNFSLNVSFESKINKAIISIYTSMGQLVYNEMICSDSEEYGDQLHLNDLIPGIYFVNVKNVNQEVSTKLIIK